VRLYHYALRLVKIARERPKPISSCRRWLVPNAVFFSGFSRSLYPPDVGRGGLQEVEGRRGSRADFNPSASGLYRRNQSRPYFDAKPDLPDEAMAAELKRHAGFRLAPDSSGEEALAAPVFRMASEDRPRRTAGIGPRGLTVCAAATFERLTSQIRYAILNRLATAERRLGRSSTRLSSAVPYRRQRESPPATA
jgi:hypothetical protein